MSPTNIYSGIGRIRTIFLTRLPKEGELIHVKKKVEVRVLYVHHMLKHASPASAWIAFNRVHRMQPHASPPGCFQPNLTQGNGTPPYVHHLTF